MRGKQGTHKGCPYGIEGYRVSDEAPTGHVQGESVRGVREMREETGHPQGVPLRVVGKCLRMGQQS